MIRYKLKSNQFLLVMFCVTSILFISCSNKNSDEKYINTDSIESEIIVLKADSATITKVYPAQISGKNNIEIRPQISGFIEQIFVDEGQYVKAGTLLFKINAGTLQQEKNQAIASLNAAKSQLASASLDLEKYQNLSENKVVTDFQYKKAKSVFDLAKSQVQQQEALIASIDIQLSYTKIKAPVGGYVGRLHKKMGTLVSPTDPDPLTTVSEVSEIYAYFSLSEKDILMINNSSNDGKIQEKLRGFDQVQLQLADGSVYPQKGKIDMMDGQFNNQTASISVRASFLNPSHLLRSGNTGRVLLKTQESDIIKIPVLATLEIQDQIFVGKLTESLEVEYVALSDFSQTDDYYVVRNGFKNGEKIIAKELARIPEKTKITIKSKD